MRLMVRSFKFGILYATENQKSEQEFFRNTVEGENFQEFLQFIGNRIELTNWGGYAAGLDVARAKTGTHSIYTNFQGYEIMFHVSTYLPFEEDDSQQVARKRHLGNDIVLIIFQDKGHHPLFDPRWMSSYYNHVFIVIRKDEESSNNTMYRVAVCYKDGVEVCGPGIPASGLFEKGEDFRVWLLTKMINCERASYSAPGFAKAMERTRFSLLQALHEEYYPTQTGAWTS
jgi:RAP1 GTPase activating protein 1